jgi:fructose-1,6-bisphosphatase II / sedoheptulose-1,7-bisphosphatase
MQGRLIFRNDDERTRAQRCGITDLGRKYGMLDLAHGEVMFAATGVTDGTMLRGVRRFHGGATTHSMVMRSKSGTVRVIEAQHNFERKTGFDA